MPFPWLRNAVLTTRQSTTTVSHFNPSFFVACSMRGTRILTYSICSACVVFGLGANLFLSRSYRIHLSPGSRRNSKSRVLGTTAKRTSAILDPPPPPPSPPLSPPRLEPARIYMHHSTPPDSPPPLAHATLPVLDSLSGDNQYSAVNQHSLISPGLPPSYSYPTGTSYGESSQFSYVNDSSSSFPSYHNSQEYETHHLPHLNTVIPPSHSHSPSPVSSISIGSRHSIAHISHPYNGTNPPSPASSQSISSHPPTPPLTYPIYENDYHHGNNSIVHEQLPLSAHTHIPQHHHSPHSTYSPTMAIHPSAIPSSPRYPSPPPVLAPLQGNVHNNHTQYLHHSHSGSADFGGYRHSYSHHHHHHPRHLSLAGHDAWKAHSKGIEGLVQ